MDTDQRVELVARPPTEEIVTAEGLRDLFETNDSPKHYIGLEISGFLHLGSLLSTGFKVNDMARAGVRCTVFLADWHTVINDKLGGDWDAISEVAGYYRRAFGAVCPDARIALGSDLYRQNPQYWGELVRVAKHMSLARTKRALTIMGRSETDSLDLAKLLYPPMQAADIHTMDLDIVHAGMDQRKIHMLVREIFPKMGWKVPVAVHHSMLPGLGNPAASDTKMSKSSPDSGVFLHESDAIIRKKIAGAWCPAGSVEGNPVLGICRQVIFHEADHVTVERPDRFGGDVTYYSYEELERDFLGGGLHPADLKAAVGDGLVKIVGRVRDAVPLDDGLAEAIRQSV